ncbi:Crp/Fnr family transcriptional regulator [Liquorilactobacillus capillatus]|uniref:HTH crp-type domain-containing protein n=1 Tax=Liquorilactobacillus capillatus DSM 19910 TaxID=1423731 RepID=A0A0R1M4Z1_9LACO|nr:Crp/Fnr family transcriptional regulator [Liquorilactobacillus capillatus]KRL03175.1 hypothetical protein FC81_GL000177 [Liquorilactobacillus capillatus DSM 19910]
MIRRQQALISEKLAQLRVGTLLDEHSINELLAFCTYREFEHRDNMGYRPGDFSKVYLIVHGIVSVKISNEKGKNIRCFLLGKNDFFPIIMFAGNNKNSILFEVNTCSRVEVLIMPFDKIKSLTKRNIRIHELHIQMKDELIEERTNHAIDLSAPQMRERVVAELLFIGEKFGETCPEGLKVKDHWITREMLGYLVGTTSKTVNTTLAILEQRALITLSRHVWILRPKFLEKYRHIQ